MCYHTLWKSYHFRVSLGIHRTPGVIRLHERICNNFLGLEMFFGYVVAYFRISVMASHIHHFHTNGARGGGGPGHWCPPSGGSEEKSICRQAKVFNLGLIAERRIEVNEK